MKVTTKTAETIGAEKGDNQIILRDAQSGKKLFFYLTSNLWLVGVIVFISLGVLGASLKYLDDDAQRVLARRAAQKDGSNNQQDESFLNKINPFLPLPTPTPLPLSKEYIYAGSRLLAVEDANANAVLPADIAIWRPGDGNWWVTAGTGTVTQQWGMAGDIPAPGDFDGDGKADFAIFRPSSGYWWVIRSSNNTYFAAPLGSSGDTPVVADYDGDGKSDLAAYTPSTGMWWIFQTAGEQTASIQFGLSGDYPAPADYDGDGTADIAVWRNSDQKFYVRTSSAPYYYTTLMGSVSSTKPVSADYDGDGAADFALVEGSGGNTATWHIKASSNPNQTQSIAFGIGSDKPVPHDYDGDGKTDIAYWRGVVPATPGYARWYIRDSSNPTTTREVQFGAPDDIPVPALWKR